MVAIHGLDRSLNLADKMCEESAKITDSATDKLIVRFQWHFLSLTFCLGLFATRDTVLGRETEIKFYYLPLDRDAIYAICPYGCIDAFLRLLLSAETSQVFQINKQVAFNDQHT